MPGPAPSSPLLLSYEFPPRVYGGLGRHVSCLASAFAATGAQVSVATLSATDGGTDAGIRVRRTVPVPAVGDGDDWLASVLAFDSALVAAAAPLADGSDVVHAHDWLVARTAVTLRSAFGLPLVVTVHATERGRHQGWLPDATSRFVDAVERWLAASADAVIVCTQAMRRAVTAQWQLDPVRVHVVGNGVTPSPLPRAPLDGVLLFAGRLEHEKGGQDLLEALAILRRRGVTARVVVAGTGSQDRTWRDRARRLGVAADVEFVGRLALDDLRAQYARAAVVVVPSLYEPFGMVAAEAMAAGAPVVASAVDGLPEVVADGGTLVPAADPSALADALERLLTSPAARRAAAAAARRRAEQMPTWAEVAGRTAAVYEAVTHDNRRHVWSG